jgi:hypothetical protein
MVAPQEDRNLLSVHFGIALVTPSRKLHLSIFRV